MELPAICIAVERAGWPTLTLRPELPQALAQLRRLDIRQIELLTGDKL